MNRRLTKLLLLVATVVGIGVFGCDRTPHAEDSTGGEESSAGETAKADGYHYSSFGIRLERGAEFELISFKDVGLGRSEPKPTDPLLEAIAQSLAYELQIEESLNVGARVVHDASLADPDAHTYCEGERLYIDVWRSESPDRWGYSLWSGCSEQNKFAREEVPAPAGAEAAEPEEAVEPLTREIADSIQSATESDCYRRTC